MKKLMGIAVVVMVALTSVLAGGVKYQAEDGKYVKLGGRIQFQYHYENPDSGDTEDVLFFRRFRPYIEGSIHEDWKGKFQWDMGKSGLALKDAYMRYTRLDAVEISVGNQNFPFSRELLTSSKYQQLVERTFVGDHNYGTPDRQAGVHLTGEILDGELSWGASLCKGAIDPSTSKLDFDTVVNNSSDDWNEGWMGGARVDWHPMGKLKFSQADFSGDMKATVGGAVFGWANDDDVLDGAAAGESKDVDQVFGFEISGAARGAGVSIDAQVNVFQAELKDKAVTAGIYKMGETDLINYAIEGGYMLPMVPLEIVGGYQAQDADGYAETWTRMSVGVNYYFARHDIKVQTTCRMGTNKDGKDGNDLNELFVQAQYVF